MTATLTVSPNPTSRPATLDADIAGLPPGTRINLRVDGTTIHTGRVGSDGTLRHAGVAIGATSALGSHSAAVYDSANKKVIIAPVAFVVATAPPPPPPAGYPPDKPWAFTATPTVPMPGYRQKIVDPTYGVEVVRVGNADQVGNAYSSLPAWNADGSLLALSFGSSAWARMVDGNTYADLYAVGSDFVWAAKDPAMGFRRSGTNILRYNAWLAGIAVAQTYDMAALGGYSEISLGGGQGAPSDDGRYIVLQWRRPNNDVGLSVLDTTSGTIAAELRMSNSTAALTKILNACGMSHSGDYLFLENGPQDVSPGGDPLAGGWVYHRDLSPATRRQVTRYSRHFDWGWNGSGQEVVATASQIAGGGDGVDQHLGTYRASDGSWTELAAVWPNGHVSGRNNLRPGWFCLSHFTAGGTHPGAGTVLAVKHDDPTVVEYFGHTHHATSPGYAGETQAVPSPDLKKVAFRSPWTPENGDGKIYGFVVGMHV